MNPLPTPNNYQERLIEKLRQQVMISGPDCPAAAELAILENSAGGVPSENATKSATEKKKPQENK